MCLAVLLAPHIEAIAQSTAQPSPAAEPLPAAKQVIDRYLQALGGREALLKISSRYIRGTAEFAPGLIGAIQIYEKPPNKLLVDIELEGRRIREGFDGKVGWTADPKNGVVEKPPAESAAAGRGASFYGLLNQIDRYAQVTVTGRALVGERQTWRVEGTLHSRGIETIYYDVETGLMLRRVNTGPGPDGDRSESTFDDYREVDGVKYAFTHRMVTSGRTVILRAIELKHNVAIEDSRFSKPAAP